MNILNILSSQSAPKIYIKSIPHSFAHLVREIDRQTDSDRDRQRQTKIEIEIETETERQTETETETHTQRHRDTEIQRD